MLFFSKENGFCIFYQFWEIWATNEKKFSEKFFVLFFAQKHQVWKKNFDVIFQPKCSL